MKFLQFLKGYVILSLNGYNRDTSLEKIRKTGAVPRDIFCCENGISLRLTERDFRLIEDMEELEFRVEAARGGIFFLKKVLGRKLLIPGIITVCLTVFFGSGFIWTVEYSGVSDRKFEEVRAAVEKAGVIPGARKKSLLSPMEIKNTILANTRDIAWCWVYIKGTRAVVEVRESVIPPEIFSPDTPCHIVAAKDGVVEKIIARRGVPIVRDNTSVARGDVLIRGRVSFGEDEGYFVHASGTCLARTCYEKEGVYKLYRNYKTYTGKKRNLLTLKLFKFRLPLYFNGKIDFKYSDKEEKLYEISLGRDNYIGIGLEKVSFFEYNVMKEPISRELCEKLAGEELEAEIAKELLPGSQLVSSETFVEIIDEETVSVRKVMEFTENIGTENYIEEVKLIEPKTD